MLLNDILDVTKTVTVAGICQGKATLMNLKTSLVMMNFFVEVDGNFLFPIVINFIGELVISHLFLKSINLSLSAKMRE